MADVWTSLKLVSWTQEFFARKGVDAPRLTAELLLAHALSCDRVRLYLDFDKPLREAELARYRDLVRRRAEGEPTAYIVGKKDFYGRGFRVDPRVLVPRPETELVLEAALAALPDDGRCLDLCTGSGCIAVSLALERKGTRVVATDSSAEALDVARENARLLGAVVEFAAGDLWAAVHGGERFDVVVSNPPYIPTKELAGLPREVRQEPCIALDGGVDGLAVLRRIVEGAPAWLEPGSTLIVEMHETHEKVLPGLCLAAGFAAAEARRDLAGLPRLTVARMAGARTPA
jgi:release factor glutamine methyltransferase